MAIYFGKTVDEKYALSNEYYSAESHIRHHDWTEETESDKKAALVQAEREINLYLGTNLERFNSDTDWPVDAHPNLRPDYAIFEQSLYILDETVRAKAGTDGPKQIESELYQEQEENSGVGMSPQAMRFLQLNRLQSARG